MSRQNFSFAVIYTLAMLMAAGLIGLIKAPPQTINVQVRIEKPEKNDSPAFNQILINPIYRPNKDDLYSPNLYTLAPKNFFGVFYYFNSL